MPLLPSLLPIASNSRMTTTADTRRHNLELLITRSGTLERCAEIGDTNWVYLSQLRHAAADSKNGRPREMGVRLARKLEQKFGLPNGWMDKDHSVEPPQVEGPEQVTVVPVDVSNSPHVRWGETMTAQLPAVFAATIPDDAMAPRVRRGDVVRFSSLLKPAAGDGVLVTDARGRWYFRLYKEITPQEWEAHALNDAYTAMAANKYELSVIAVLVGIESQRWGTDSSL